MIFRIRFQQVGGHIHGRLFQTKAPGQTWSKNGDLVFDEQGWEAFRALVAGRMEFVPEETAAEAKVEKVTKTDSAKTQNPAGRPAGTPSKP